MPGPGTQGPEQEKNPATATEMTPDDFDEDMELQADEAEQEDAGEEDEAEGEDAEADEAEDAEDEDEDDATPSALDADAYVPDANVDLDDIAVDEDIEGVSDETVTLTPDPENAAPADLPGADTAGLDAAPTERTTRVGAGAAGDLTGMDEQERSATDTDGSDGSDVELGDTLEPEPKELRP
jgi:hypothetical protein